MGQWLTVLAGLLCWQPVAAHSNSGQGDLWSVPPMIGRATSRGADLTLNAADKPIEVRLTLRVDGPADAGRPEQCRFSAPRSLAHLDAASWVLAHPTQPSVSPAAGSSTSLRVQAMEYVEIRIAGLQPGTAYRFDLVAVEAAPGLRRGAAVRSQTHTGRFVTRQPRGASFRFAVFSDPHFFVPDLEPKLPREVLAQESYFDYSLQSAEWFRSTREEVLEEFRRVAVNMNAERPDFVVGLGDHFDLHGLDFNAPFEDQDMADSAHREARRRLSELSECGAIYQILGNWEGESGCHPEYKRALARTARQRFTVNPRRSGVPGNDDEDYYQFTWGDVLLIGLNVRGFTSTRHDLGLGDGGPEDFTLGPAQREFLENTLQASDHAYKVLLIHHTVGGRAGDEENSAYGRGGGQAYDVGEQAWVHDLMKRTGVQLFLYGHDHVFTDLEVDGIHYTLPGTTGAPWRFSTEETGYEEYWPDAGHARVSVTPERLTVEFVSVERTVLYSYSVQPR